MAIRDCGFAYDHGILLRRGESLRLWGKWVHSSVGRAGGNQQVLVQIRVKHFVAAAEDAVEEYMACQRTIHSRISSTPFVAHALACQTPFVTSSVTYADGMRTSATAAYAPTISYPTQIKNPNPGRGYLLWPIYHSYDLRTQPARPLTVLRRRLRARFYTHRYEEMLLLQTYDFLNNSVLVC